MLPPTLPLMLPSMLLRSPAVQHCGGSVALQLPCHPPPRGPLLWWLTGDCSWPPRMLRRLKVLLERAAG